MCELDASDVLALLATVTETLDMLALDEPLSGTPTDRLAVWERLGEIARTAGLAKKKVGAALHADLGKGDHPLDDGMVLHVGYRANRSGWAKDELRSELTRWALGVTDDGEITVSASEAVANVWSVADVATGRSAVLRGVLGGDLDEYCKETFEPSIERRAL